MSDNIPFEMQAEIIRRLPIIPLIQFRSVSKAWKSHIDSSHFIAHYQHPQHLLLVTRENDQKFLSIVDDHTFPKQKLSLTAPMSTNMLKYCNIIGSSHGLLCFYGGKGRDPFSGSSKVVLWNPSIRKSVDVIVPPLAKNGIYAIVLGFGVCLTTTDPKIVKITYFTSSNDCYNPCQVEVSTLSTGFWRSPYSSKRPLISIQLDFIQVAVDGFLYWLATDSITTDGGNSRFDAVIVSFDITSEEFGEVRLPDT